MRLFFKIFFATLLALVIFTIAGIFISGWFINSAVAPEKSSVKTNTVLVLDLSKILFEQKKETGLSFPDGQTPGANGLFDIIKSINTASTDKSVKGIYIKCEANPNGFATSQELRTALLNFKLAKKFVIAYANSITQKAYYVANVADKVYLHPNGSLDWQGFTMQYTFIKGMLDKLEIQPEIFYAGQFKSATEPLREKQMTAANKLQSMAFLNDMYSLFLQAAAIKSGADTAMLHQLANNFTIQTASDAFKYNLIDGLRYDDEVKEEIQLKAGIAKTDQIPFMAMADYIKATDQDNTAAVDKIALVFAEGEIVDGKGDDNEIGGETYLTLLRKVRVDSSIKAVVLRINSGGGSSMASDLIWREAALIRKTKPLIVSMGDYAASGGYYMACQADSVFAQPNTLSGSIGVFSIYGNIAGFMNNKLGITFDGVKTSPYADFGSASRPMTEKEKQVAQSSVDSTYQIFKTRVSEGRKIPLINVDSLAQGRIWSGRQALQLRLVDKLGNLQDAIDCAARMAKLKKYGVKELPAVKSLWDKILNPRTSTTAFSTTLIVNEIGAENVAVLKQIKTAKSWIGTSQMRLPFFVSFN